METGSLAKIIFTTAFYKRSEMEDHEQHFVLNPDELVVYLGEKNYDDYIKCMARGAVGWIGVGAYEWLG
jgi:hypothetical protein